MLVPVENILTAGELEVCKTRLAKLNWVDGRASAGHEAALVKNNLQVPGGEPGLQELVELVLQALRRNLTFVSAALPLQVLPPLFSRYETGMAYDSHIDNAIRVIGATTIRTDLSATIFLNDPTSYDGGELVIDDVFGMQAVKLRAGDMILYPSTSRHRVAPVTKGTRLAAVFWVQSLVRSDEHRTILFDLDQASQRIAKKLGAQHSDASHLTGTYNNLLRMWADV
jgi:PKHD-type hydroxylase